MRRDLPEPFGLDPIFGHQVKYFRYSRLTSGTQRSAKVSAHRIPGELRELRGGLMRVPEQLSALVAVREGPASRLT
jgi:hypothetical protein